MKNKKFIIDAVLIIVALIIAYFFILLFLLSPFIEIVDGPFVVEGKIYHTTDIEELKLNAPLLPVPIEAIDCTYSLQREGFWQDDGVYPAVREEAYVEINSYGGDTTGYQIPFTLHYTGKKTKGTFDVSTRVFTEA